ncbi:methyltransferase family protein [Chloroflexota bacterium]
MSLVPAFEIGVWNAWIFMIWLLIQNFGIGLINKDLYKKAGHPSDMQQSQIYKIVSYISMPLWLLVTAYSIFLPLKTGTIFFYVGITIFLLGLIINTGATINFGKTPINKPVTRGVYRLSRHPIYLGLLLIYLSVGIASVSWLFLVLTAFSAILINLSVADEERYCLNKYGDAYREYMNRTPRWIGILKSGK